MSSDTEGIDEPLFANLNDRDPELIAAVGEAKATMRRFKVAVAGRFGGAAYLVKVPFVDRSDVGKAAIVRTPQVATDNPTLPVAHLWLYVTSVFDDLFFCSVAEAPRQLRLRRGDCFVIAEDNVEDWVINHQGVAEGAFSLRVVRNRLRGLDQQRFDDHTGIREFKS
jgi:hypothetical protein